MPETAEYGFWKSPITSDLIVAETISLGQIALSGDDVYWSEGRPSEGGRSVIVCRRPDGSTHDVNPAPFNARTRVHEYGGGAFLVDGSTVYFSNFKDQRLYRVLTGRDAPGNYARGSLALRGRGQRPLTRAADLRARGSLPSGQGSGEHACGN